MNSIFLFTGYNRTDLVEFFLSKNIVIHALIIPSLEKYISNMGGILSCCSKNSIPILTSKSVGSAFDQETISNSTLYSSGYPLLVKPDIYSKFKFAINCHPALLPRNRGKYLEYIFLNNDEYSGTTLHHIDKGCDSGPIILQSSFKVDLTDTVNSLLKKSYTDEIKLLEKLLTDNDILLNSYPQDESLATTYITQRTPKDSMVEHSLSLLEAFKLSRAFDNERYPGFFIYNDYKITFKMEATKLTSEDKKDYDTI